MVSLKQLPHIFADTIYIPIKIYLFVGLDFFDDKKTRFKNRCKLFFFIINFFAFLTDQIFFFVKADEIGADFLNISSAIACLIIVLQCFFKLKLFRNPHLIRQIILDIAELWSTDIQNEEKAELMNKWHHDLKKFCDNVFKFTMVVIFIYMWLEVFIYFVNTSRSDGDATYLYPFQLYYPFKVDSLWKYFLVYLTQSIMGTTIYTCIYYSCEYLLFVLTVNVCILLRMLQFDLANIRVEHGSAESLDDLKQIVKTHQKLLRLTDSLNDIFGSLMFSVIAFSSLIICFFGFLSIVVKAKIQLLMNVVAVVQVLLTVFCIMLPGQILLNTSSGIADAAYESMWYNSDTKFRKMLLIIIARSQKPCKLRAMGYTDMNFEAYCKICSSAWSYLSLINQMYQNVEFEV